MVEYPLLHEMGHHLSLLHEEDATGGFEFNPLTSHIPAQDGSLAIPNTRFAGDKSQIATMMMNTGYDKGLSEYAARTLAYRFQPIPGRGIPSRIGPVNGAWGGNVVRKAGRYWDPYPPASPFNWPLFEVPKALNLRLVDGTGQPLAGASVDLYVPGPVPADVSFPQALGFPFSVRWTGSFIPPRTGMYQFVTYSLGNVRVQVAGSELVNPSGRNPIYLADSRPSQPGREFRHGLYDTGAIPLEGGKAYPIVVEYNSFDRYGGYRFGLFYKSADANPPINLSEIPPDQLRSDTGEPGGLTARYWNGGAFGEDGGALVETRPVQRPEALKTDMVLFGATPAAHAFTGSDGVVHLDTIPYISGAGVNQRKEMVAVVTKGGRQAIRIVPLSDLNIAFWSGKRETAELTLDLALDGTRRPLIELNE